MKPKPPQRSQASSPRAQQPPVDATALAPARGYPGAHFIQSAAHAAQFPPDDGAEVAIAGRSNAGKSSAVNALTGRHALARASKSPGRTRLLNFFSLAPSERLVDLPGYGYAAGPKGDRAAWATLAEALIRRGSLQGLLLVVDARRGLQSGDEQLLAWARAHGRPVHVLLSKSDLLTRSEARALLQRCERELSSGGATVQLFSARDGAGVAAAREHLAGWLAPGKRKRPDNP